jgi:FtsP/CotA-like multicopper oxidase with cupredoxin domain
MRDDLALTSGWLRRFGRSRLTPLPFAGACLLALLLGPSGLAREAPPVDVCQRPEAGGAVSEPENLRSQNGILRVELAMRDQKQPDGSTRYCFVTPSGTPSPTLRLKPGDLLILSFKNKLVDFTSTAPGADPGIAPGAAPVTAPAATHGHAEASAPTAGPVCTARTKADPCTSGEMSATSANLHFHGLTVPPVCHQDDVLKTSVQADDAPFEYRLRIPADEPPGLYWYHPHIHGYSKAEVLGGASGALIVEGTERVNPEVAGLPERVLMIRDQDLVNPDAPPAKSEPVVPKNLVESDGDALNNGSGFGKPAKDLSVNFVPVPYPDYPPASITMKPGERQLWRVVNASAITYLNLALLFQRTPQRLGIVAIDGVPINFNGSPAPSIEWVDHIGLPPGARAEFIVTGPPLGVPGLLVTRTVDTGPGGENDPNRALATVTAAADAPEPSTVLPANPESPPPSAKPKPWIGTVAPVRVRKLYFSEKLQDPNDPNSPTTFYLTVDGKEPTPFDPSSDVPDIVVKQGDVEDWIIENRSSELHDFHIHQLHFQLVDWSGVPVNEPFLRDTVNVPYYNGHTLAYPSVRLRMDFRDPNIVGTFVYHCHLLEHEDGGMMGRIKVEPAETAVSAQSSNQSNKGGLYDAH